MNEQITSSFPSWRRFGRAAFAGWLIASALSACAGGSSEAPLRSPTHDYPPPPPRESDGRVMGADNIPPGERLEQGAAVGTDNELAPGWQVGEEKPLEYDPEKRKGGATELESQPPEPR